MDFPPYMGSSVDIHRTWNYNFKMISISSWIYDLVKNVNNNSLLNFNIVFIINNLDFELS